MYIYIYIYIYIYMTLVAFGLTTKVPSCSKTDERLRTSEDDGVQRTFERYNAAVTQDLVRNMSYCHAAPVRMLTLRSHSTYHVVCHSSLPSHIQQTHCKVFNRKFSANTNLRSLTHTNTISRHPTVSLAQAHFLTSSTFHHFHFVPLSSGGTR